MYKDFFYVPNIYMVYLLFSFCSDYFVFKFLYQGKKNIFYSFVSRNILSCSFIHFVYFTNYFYSNPKGLSCEISRLKTFLTTFFFIATYFFINTLRCIRIKRFNLTTLILAEETFMILISMKEVYFSLFQKVCRKIPFFYSF